MLLLQSNGEGEGLIQNGESLEDNKQKIITETPQRQSAVKGKRKRQATTSTPTVAKRTLLLKTTSSQNQTAQARKSKKRKSASVKLEGVYRHILRILIILYSILGKCITLFVKNVYLNAYFIFIK